MKANGKGTSRVTEEDLEVLRHTMVREQIRARGIVSPRLLEAMAAVPRHEFVPPDYAELAYGDQPLPIGEGQTISQPFMVAAMIEALELAGGERVLEIGTGSGYQASLLARLAREVFTIENIESLAEAAVERLERLECSNVAVRVADGTLGWPERGPFDAIVVSAAAPRIPPPLVEQLAEGGRLVIPVGDEHQQELLQIHRAGDELTTSTLHYCRFVPLVGRYGWRSRPG
jgi:protein-L-isoaspartate(D-aspartate) O-methyltransferase